jgi:hypothetical protein
MVYPDAVIGMVGEDRMATFYGCQWVIANYERSGGLVKETGLDFAVMAVDEAHYLKEHNSGRTRNVFLLASRIPRRYAVTGTPLLNREIELHTLLRLTGHRLGQMPLADFRKQYTGHKDKRAALADALKGWMLRRRKDVLKDLGTKTKQVRYLSPAQGIESYTQVVKDMTLMVMPKIVKLRQALEALKTQFLMRQSKAWARATRSLCFVNTWPPSRCSKAPSLRPTSTVSRWWAATAAPSAKRPLMPSRMTPPFKCSSAPHLRPVSASP